MGLHCLVRLAAGSNMPSRFGLLASKAFVALETLSVFTLQAGRGLEWQRWRWSLCSAHL
jgi:hypothetical protein